MTGIVSSSACPWLGPAAVGWWLGDCGPVQGLWGGVHWLGGCSAMAECNGPVCESCSMSTGPGTVAASEVWGETDGDCFIYLSTHPLANRTETRWTEVRSGHRTLKDKKKSLSHQIHKFLPRLIDAELSEFLGGLQSHNGCEVANSNNKNSALTDQWT